MMGILALIITVLGFLMMAVGSVWFLIAAFRVSALWGIAVLFLPFANIFFLIKHWYDAKRPFQYQFLGFLMLIIGSAMTFRAGAQVANGKMTQFEEELKKQLMEINIGQEGEVPPGVNDGTNGTGAQADYVMRYQGEVKDLRMVGQTLQQAREQLGPPKGILRTERGVTYFYPGLELVAQDGRTISGQSFPVE
jgi:hypothetical protein